METSHGETYENYEENNSAGNWPRRSNVTPEQQGIRHEKSLQLRQNRAAAKGY